MEESVCCDGRVRVPTRILPNHRALEAHRGKRRQRHTNHLSGRRKSMDVIGMDRYYVQSRFEGPTFYKSNFCRHYGVIKFSANFVIKKTSHLPYFHLFLISKTKNLPSMEGDSNSEVLKNIFLI